jgi:hypothetical protein
LVKAVYLVEPDGAGNVCVGVTVPRRNTSAVLRNRIKRLLRVAIGRELEHLRKSLAGSGLNLRVVFQFRSSSSMPVRKITVDTVETDVRMLCELIGSRAITPKKYK